MKNFLLILSCLCIAIMTQAQERTVTGTVVDGLKDPLIGVSIQQKGTDNGTITDADGRFSLTIRTNADAVLVFSYIGYVSQEIIVGNQQVLNVTLSEDTEQLDEVVVVGYGVQKKSSMTASVASVSVDEIQKQVAPNVASTLQGRIPGVEILQKGGEAGAGSRRLADPADAKGSAPGGPPDRRGYFSGLSEGAPGGYPGPGSRVPGGKAWGARGDRAAVSGNRGAAGVPVLKGSGGDRPGSYRCGHEAGAGAWPGSGRVTCAGHRPPGI